MDFQEDSIDNFQGDIPAIQKSMFKEVLLLSMQLDVDKDGNIKNTVANRRKVQRFKTIRNKILTPTYRSNVNVFLNDFNVTKEKTDDYINSLDA